MLMIASDYDGTLCRYGKITKGDRESIAKWRAKGNLFGFVTGRGADFLKTASELELESDFFVLHTGADIYDGEGNSIARFDADRELIPLLDECCGSFGALKYNPECTAGFFLQYYALTQTEAECTELCSVINEKYSDRITAYQNGRNVNAVKRGVSKANGIAVIAERFGIEKSRIAAVGDTLNDLSMLTEYNGFAMYTASAQVKRLAPNSCKNIGDLIKQLTRG